MTAKIVTLNPAEVGDGFRVDPDAVLEAAKGRVPVVVVVGVDKDGNLYVAGSDGSETTHFLLHRAAAYILNHNVVR